MLPPFTGSFKPAQSLSLLQGESVNGTWTLQIQNSGRQSTTTYDELVAEHHAGHGHDDVEPRQLDGPERQRDHGRAQSLDDIYSDPDAIERYTVRGSLRPDHAPADRPRAARGQHARPRCARLTSGNNLVAEHLGQRH